MKKITNCNKCGKFINIDKAEIDILKNKQIKVYHKKCIKKAYWFILDKNKVVKFGRINN